MQEKVLRLYFGLGCERTRTAGEMAEEFGVSAQVIGGILGAGQRRLGDGRVEGAGSAGSRPWRE
jgi:DNA-directed RNA polymerase sigma subunit (sigma70/sigma32)